jgi:hypothetical protein
MIIFESVCCIGLSNETKNASIRHKKYNTKPNLYFKEEERI